MNADLLPSIPANLLSPALLFFKRSPQSPIRLRFNPSGSRKCLDPSSAWDVLSP